jgi:hypothetical protein
MATNEDVIAVFFTGVDQIRVMAPFYGANVYTLQDEN